ncbi:MAG: hypothetical protein F4020_03120, partial [Gammaproteobacteria bacterium]|nr:hypothetical protein [Gammaproteobacteria bacterium]
ADRETALAATVGAAFSWQAPEATDPEGGVLIYAAELSGGAPLPGWLAFDAATRTLSGTPRAEDALAEYGIALWAMDDGDPPLAGSMAVTLTVAAGDEGADGPNAAPAFAQAPAGLTATEGEAFSWQAPEATDPDGDAVAYSAALADGGDLPGWLAFDAATRTLSGTPGADDAPAALEIAVRATDDGTPALSATARLALTVEKAKTCVTAVAVGAVPVILQDEPWDVPGCRAHHRENRPARYFTFSLDKAEIVSVGVATGETAALFVSKGTPRNGWGTAPRAGMAHRLAVRRANGSLLHEGATSATLALAAGDYAVEAVLAEDPEDGAAGPPAFGLGIAVETPATAVSVADARAKETAGAMAFAVTLDGPAPAGGVTVRYATSDGTAVAGSDYVAASGTLAFAAAERRKTVSVTVLDDAVDDGGETFALTLSHPQGAALGDATATGTIDNADPLQRAWLARFGRAAASQTVAALERRLALPPGAAPHVTLAGRRVPMDAASWRRERADAPREADDAFAALATLAARGEGAGTPEGPGGAEPQGMTGRELLLSSSFLLAPEGAAPDGAARWTAWGGAGLESFSGTEDGLSVEGEAVTGVFGIDREGGRWLAGVALTHAAGDGEATGAGRTYGLRSAVTALNPYARYAVSDRVTAWGLVGAGRGRVEVSERGAAGSPVTHSADLSMRLAALGGRAALPGIGGMDLALKGDAFAVRMESDGTEAEGVGVLRAASGDSSRVRVALEGSRRVALAGGGTLTPRIEVALRHDGGDAETGAGIELGGGIAYARPDSRLATDLRVRVLAAHAGGGHRERGVTGTVRIAPDGRGRGLSLSLASGAGAEGGADVVWSTRDAAALVPGTAADAGARLSAEVGWGLPFRTRFTGTPYAGLSATDAEYRARFGWRLRPADDGPFRLSLEASRREADGEDAANGVGIRIETSW